MKASKLKKLLHAQLSGIFNVFSYDKGRLLEIHIPSPLKKHDVYPLYLEVQKRGTWRLTDDGFTLQAMRKRFGDGPVFQNFLTSETFPKILDAVGLGEKEGALTRLTVPERLAGDLIRFMLQLGNVWDHVHLIVSGREMENAGVNAC